MSFSDLLGKSDHFRAGGNNCIRKVRGENLAIKIYMSSKANAFWNEIQFLTEARKVGCENVPRVYGSWERIPAISMDFIEGKQAELDERYINAYLNFLERLRLIPLRGYQRSASEGARSTSEFYKLVNNKLDVLCDLASKSELKKLQTAIADIRSRLSGSKLHFSVVPSDSGIHNTILDSYARLWFIDFEHGGIDALELELSKWVNQPLMNLDFGARCSLLEHAFQEIGILADVELWVAAGALFWALIRFRRNGDFVESIGSTGVFDKVL